MQDKTNKEEIPDVEKEGWEAANLTEESTNIDENDVVQQLEEEDAKSED